MNACNQNNSISACDCHCYLFFFYFQGKKILVHLDVFFSSFDQIRRLLRESDVE